MSELISILMPVKNASNFLTDCLHSIKVQSYSHWELIAVNDHSTDNSLQLLEKFAADEQRIKPIDNKGNGIIDALKTAYEYASGNYIHRMDADDIMVEDKLLELKSLLDKNGKGCVSTGMVKYFSEGKLNNGFLKYEKWLNSLCEQNSHWSEIYKECVIASPNWLIHRDDLENCGAFNKQQYPEDYDLVFRFYKHNMKVVAINKVLHLWRDHAERSSRNLPQYKDNDFFDIKWQYYEEVVRDKSRPLMIWGAGRKGKKMAKLLKKNKVKFEWVSNNPNKHGREIYEKILRSFRRILQKDNPQIIIAVGQVGAKNEITKFLNQNNMYAIKDFTFFC